MQMKFPILFFLFFWLSDWLILYFPAVAIQNSCPRAKIVKADRTIYRMSYKLHNNISRPASSSNSWNV